MKNKKNILIAGGIFLGIAILCTGVYIFAQHTATNAASQRTGNFGNFANRANLGFITGSVQSIQNNTAIVNNTNSSGQTLVFLSDTTRVSQIVLSSQQDVLTDGATVIVNGQRNGNTITATRITSSTIATPSRRAGGFRARGGANFNPNNQLQQVNTFLGTVSSITSNGFNLLLRGGSSYAVTISTSTIYSKQTIATIQDIVSGKTITATGTKEQNGDIQARSVTITG